MRYTKKLPYTDLAVDAWHRYFNQPVPEDSEAKIADYAAAKNAIERLNREDSVKLQLLRKVYGVPRKDSVGSRVLLATFDLSISETTEWRWLNRANRYWAEERGVA